LKNFCYDDVAMGTVIGFGGALEREQMSRA